MSDDTYNYFLEHAIFGKKQVTREEWIKAERSAGFHPKYGGDGPATGGFSGNGISGSILPKAKDRIIPIKLYPNKITLRDELMRQGIL
jgi:hypothetical protein